MEENFTPEIIAFCCHYCAYAAADLAGSMRLEYPSSIKVIEMQVDCPATAITWKVISKPEEELNTFVNYWVK